MSSFFWWLREHVGGIALVIALLAAGAGAAGVVIALDAKDQADDASAAAEDAESAETSVPEGDINAQVQSNVDDLNERVAQIEESVASLRTEISTTSETTTTEDDTTTDTTTTPELPEGVPDIPGVPESEAPSP
jgi:hypothetical protein